VLVKFHHPSLCRLYEPSRGRILLDGIDIRDLPQSELRCRMGVILQEGFICRGCEEQYHTRRHLLLDEIRAAAEKTNVAQFIEQLPQGYDTELRERGTNLSSGQKQLLAFAALLFAIHAFWCWMRQQLAWM